MVYEPGKELIKFESVADSLAQAEAARTSQREGALSTGIRFIDLAIGEIQKTDVVLITAAPGAGKTESTMSIAAHNAARGKRVHGFFLEAERHEITQRLKFREISALYFESTVFRKSIVGRPFNYMDWFSGRFSQDIEDLEKKAEEIMKEKYKTLFAYYRDREFGIDELKRQVLAFKDQTDLFLIDHIGYVDLDGENENKAMTDLIMTIRDLALQSCKSFIIVAHIRKKDARLKQLLPDLDDIHGTSNLGKIATKAIVLAPCFDPQYQREKHLFPTFMRVAKNRRDGSRGRYTGIVSFDVRKNQYDELFKLGRLVTAQNGQTFEELKPEDYPYWAKE